MNDEPNNLDLARAFLIDSITCPDTDRSSRASRNLMRILRDKPGLEVPIKEYATSLLGTVNLASVGRINALLSILKEENAMTGAVCGPEPRFKKQGEPAKPGDKGVILK